jgi:hypothetical protein
MKVITSRNIVYQTADRFSNAPGKKDKTPKKEKTSKDGSPKKERTGFFSKAKRDERKGKRDERRAERKKKWGARPLKGFMKNGKQWFKDHVPKIKKRTNPATGKEEFVKITPPTPENPNPAPIVVPKEQIIVVPPQAVAPGVTMPTEPIIVDKKDLDNENLVDVKIEQGADGQPIVVQQLPEEKTETIVDPNTNQSETYKKTDVIDKDAKDDKKPGMSTTTKVLIGVGSALVLGVIIYVLVKNKNKAPTT